MGMDDYAGIKTPAIRHCCGAPFSNHTFGSPAGIPLGTATAMMTTTTTQKSLLRAYAQTHTHTTETQKSAINYTHMRSNAIAWFSVRVCAY